MSNAGSSGDRGPVEVPLSPPSSKYVDAPELAGGLEASTVRSVGWLAGGQAGNQVLQFFLTLVVTRLLAPEDFGLVGMSAVFVGLAAVLSDSAFGAALVQREQIEDRHLTSVFWAQLGLGFVAGAALILASPVIGRFYNEPRAAPIVAVTSANFLLASVGPVQRALLTRQMRFNTLVRIDMTAFAVSAPLVVVLAWLGAGPWSLVARGLISNAVTSAALLIAVPWRPRGHFESTALKELMAFSRNLLGFRIFSYAVRNVDNAVVGRYLGAGALGVYARGYAVLLLPIRNITRVVGSAMFPSLARLQADPVRVKRAYLRAISVIALIAMPMMAGLAVVCHEMVGVVFGEQWLDAVPVIRLFCIIGITESVGSSLGWIYQSQGRTDLLFRWGLGASAVVLVGIVFGIAGGSVMTVAAGYAMASLGLTYPAYAIPGRLIGMRFEDVVRALAAVVGCTAAMAVVAWSVGLVLPPGAPPVVLLVTRAVIGAASYLALISVFKPSPYLDLKRIVSERWSARRAAGQS